MLPSGSAKYAASAPTAARERAQRLRTRVAERRHRLLHVVHLDVELGAAVAAALELLHGRTRRLGEAVLAVQPEPVTVGELEFGVLARPFEVRLPAEGVAVELLRAIDIADCENEMHVAIVSQCYGAINSVRSSWLSPGSGASYQMR
jgi:hypothetical protein